MRKREQCCVDEASQQLATTSNGNGNALNSTAKRAKASIAIEENGDSKAEVGGNKATEQSIKPEPPKDYIHGRARRGQAKDSHSLAERARREKISERMRILQDLVPGCNKDSFGALFRRKYAILGDGLFWVIFSRNSLSSSDHSHKGVLFPEHPLEDLSC